MTTRIKKALNRYIENLVGGPSPETPPRRLSFKVLGTLKRGLGPRAEARSWSDSNPLTRRCTKPPACPHLPLL
jgi:hypothetical protein